MLITLHFAELTLAISAGPQHDVVARDVARQDDGIVVDGHPDVFAGKQQLELLLERQRCRIDDDVVLRRGRPRPRRSG